MPASASGHAANASSPKWIKSCPWTGLLGLIEPFNPKAGGGRKPYPLETMLRIHLLQNWFSLSDPAMEEALYEITPISQFARLTLSAPTLEDTMIMNFRHLLEKH